MIAFLLALLLQLAVPAQQSPPVNPSDLCTIQGVVTKAGTGEPVRKAIVEAWPAGNRKSADESAGAGETDATGQFEIKNLPPGRYTLQAERNGFVRQEYGQRAPDAPGTTLTFSAGQRVSDITIQMIPASVISGHVFDENGEPIESAAVMAMRYRYINGERRLTSTQMRRTNDIGEFRLYGLSPGQYFVQASVIRNFWDTGKSKRTYLPIFYPGASDAGRAAPIELRGGDEFPGVDITLQPVRATAIRGRVISTGCGGEPGSEMIFLSPQSPGTGVTQNGISHEVNGQSTFEFSSVPPGSYYLTGMLTGEGKPCTGRQPVEVADTDVEGVALALTPGVDFKGIVRVEGQLDSQNNSLSVSLMPKIFMITPGSSRGYGAAKPDGSFLLKNVYDGEYEIYVEGMPENFFVKSARLDGVDVLAGGVAVDTKQAQGMLEITVSANGASVDGVISKGGQPFPGATVAIVPDPPHRSERRLYKSTSSDQNGHFLLQGLSPGDYKVFGWEKIEAGAYASPEFLQPYEQQAQSVHVAEGSHNSVQVDLIPTAVSAP